MKHTIGIIVVYWRVPLSNSLNIEYYISILNLELFFNEIISFEDRINTSRRLSQERQVGKIYWRNIYKYSSVLYTGVWRTAEMFVLTKAVSSWYELIRGLTKYKDIVLPV